MEGRGSRVKGERSRVKGRGWRVKGERSRVKGEGWRVEGEGSRVEVQVEGRRLRVYPIITTTTTNTYQHTY